MRRTPVPRLPRIRVSDQGLQRFIDAMTESFEVREGRRGDRLDGNVTWRDLLDAGFGKEPRLSHGPLLEPDFPEFEGAGLPVLAIPPAPQSVSASGAINNIIVGWAEAPYANHAYAEVWRAAVDDLGQAVQIGTSAASLYPDVVGPGQAYYYWVRFVSTSDVVGPYNAVTGTFAETGLDVEYLLGLLTDDDPFVPFVVVPGDTTVNGVFVPAGTYTRSAWIMNGTITNAKIGNLAVDSAKIVDAAIVTAKIANAAITEAKIGNAQITNAKIADAAITNAKIGDAAVTNAKIGNAQITTAKIGNAQVDTLQIANGAVSAIETLATGNHTVGPKYTGSWSGGAGGAPVFSTHGWHQMGSKGILVPASVPAGTAVFMTVQAVILNTANSVNTNPAGFQAYVQEVARNSPNGFRREVAPLGHAWVFDGFDNTNETANVPSVFLIGVDFTAPGVADQKTWISHWADARFGCSLTYPWPVVGGRTYTATFWAWNGAAASVLVRYNCSLQLAKR